MAGREEDDGAVEIESRMGPTDTWVPLFFLLKTDLWVPFFFCMTYIWVPLFYFTSNTTSSPRRTKGQVKLAT
jgi:hypothetical protein